MIPDPARSLYAAHDRHLDVHQDDVPGFPVPGLHGLGAVLDDRRGETELFEQCSQDELVDEVVFRGQHTQRVWRHGRRRGFVNGGDLALGLDRAGDAETDRET